MKHLTASDASTLIKHLNEYVYSRLDVRSKKYTLAFSSGSVIGDDFDFVVAPYQKKIWWAELNAEYGLSRTQFIVLLRDNVDRLIGDIRAEMHEVGGQIFEAQLSVDFTPYHTAFQDTLVVQILCTYKETQVKKVQVKTLEPAVPQEEKPLLQTASRMLID